MNVNRASPLVAVIPWEVLGCAGRCPAFVAVIRRDTSGLSDRGRRLLLLSELVEQALGAVEGLAEVVVADQRARLGDGEPAER